MVAPLVGQIHHSRHLPIRADPHHVWFKKGSLYNYQIKEAKVQAMLWYAIHSRPNQEQRALENLQNQGYEAWLPMITLEKLRRGRVTEVVEPMFSRYLFIRLDIEHSHWTPIRSTLGVSRLVSFGNRPAPISDVLIQTLRHMPERAPEKLLQPGQAVRVIEGPLKGLEAVYHQTDGELRAMVLVDLMSKQHLVSVETQHLFPVAM